MHIHKIDNLLSTEINLYPKKWRKDFFKVLLVYPNDYYTGMSNLGFHTIYKKINELPDVVCERSFFPFLYSFETKTFIKDFDVVIFSVSFENDFLNILKMLKEANIPYFKNNRDKPFLVGGGIGVTLNPYFMKNIFNVQLIGEGEELIIEFLTSFFENKDFKNIEGVFINNKEIERRIYRGEYVAHNAIITPNTEFSNTLLIEIERGCPYSCYFCASSYNYRPYRERNKDLITDLIFENKKNVKKVGLIGSSVLSHKNFLEIGEFILGNGLPFSVSSMRLDKISDDIVSLLKRAGNKSFTVAIEAGNEILRKKINKHLSNDDIYRAIEIFIKHKILNLKFYFMIGLPDEDFSHIEDIIKIVKDIKSAYIEKKYELKKLGKFVLSVNPFVPKRNTPFFKYKMEDLESLKKKINYLKKEIKAIPNIEIICEDLYSSYMQYIISKSNSKTVEKIIELGEKNFNIKKIVQTFIDKKKEI